MQRYLLFMLLCCIANGRAFSQGKEPFYGLSSLTFFTGYGTEHHEVLNVQYDYHLIFLQLQYAHRICGGGTWQCDAFVLPQYNICFFKPQNNTQQEQWGYEAGVNAGVRISKVLLQDKLDMYLGGGTGPQYISHAPARQASGFIFSSTIIGGVLFPISPSLFADIRIGFRHISNAGFIQPNGGINIIYGCVGIGTTL